MILKKNPDYLFLELIVDAIAIASAGDFTMDIWRQNRVSCTYMDGWQDWIIKCNAEFAFLSQLQLLTTQLNPTLLYSYRLARLVQISVLSSLSASKTNIDFRIISTREFSVCATVPFDVMSE